ncbi:uncharacterized protein LOC113342427 [Papaver somniferum]|uniref:uncharacterized protein LOC113342427 n=1 Tax=Papaver somniferum TaxID=3469 RepID=UPI000E6FFCD3|nr:uncharacterized protein LOC113342427 [Papaver somniferum]
MIGRMVSEQQGVFIKGRNIHEKIFLASELVNEMNIKRRGGNVECDIQWLQKIFESARIFVLVNGGPCGFFGVGRGLRKGDHLSPILFVLVEEVLSRNITKLVQMGQEVNKVKSKCFVGGVSASRQNSIAEQMQMKLSFFPDKYLGEILNQGRVKSHQVWGIVEMMQKMLAGWMGKLLAFSPRLTLVKFVLFSMPIYNMSVYKWPKNVIQACERIIRNFLWSGDPSVKKLVTVKWDEVNSPIAEGGFRFEET